MSEENRITELAMRLMEDWQAGREPTGLARDDAYAIASGLHFEMDQRTGARAHHAAEQGLPIACEEGCSGCCENLVMVFKGEAVAIAQWLSEPGNESERAWFLESYAGWRERVGDAPDRAEAAQRAGDAAGYARAVLSAWQERVMCAFNRDNRCTVYPVRPNACRNCHALHTADRCQASFGQPPETLPFQPIQDFRLGVRPLSQAVHVALGGDPEVTVAVCQQVFEYLQQS